MKKNIPFLALFFISSALLGYIFYEKIQEKIVVIDSDRVLKNYDGFKEAQDEYEKKIESYKVSYKKQNELLESKNKAYQNSKSSITEQEKSLKEQEIIAIQNSIIQLDNAIKEKTKQEEEKLLKGVYNKVNDFIKRYCESKKIKVVIGANGMGNVVYNAPSVDRTEEIITLLNNEYVNGVH